MQQNIDSENRQKYLNLRRLFAGVTLIVALSTLLLAYVSFSTYWNNVNQSRIFTEQKTLKIAQAIAKDMEALQHATDDVKEQIEKKALSVQTVDAALSYAAINHDGFETLGVAMEPYAVGNQNLLYAPFILEQKGMVKIDHIDNYYNYRPEKTGKTAFGEYWYLNALERPSSWSSPFYERAVHKFIIKYTQPIHDPHNGKVKGVVFLDIDLSWFRKSIENHDLENNGYAIIVNKAQQVLYHGLHSTEEITGRLNGDPLAFDKSDALISEEIQHFLPGERGINSLTGTQVWHNRAKIGNTGLYLLTVMDHVYENDSLLAKFLNLEAVSSTGYISLIVITVVLLVLLYGYFFVASMGFSQRRHWIDVSIISLLLIAGTGGIWYIQYTLEPLNLENSLILSNSAVVNKFERDYSVQSVKKFFAPTAFIPTGLFIQSIKFASANSVTLSGYLWQRYPKGTVLDDTPTVIFPEAAASDVKQVYKQQEGNELVVGLHFETTLNEHFDYNDFPLDRQLISVRMWHKQFGSNTVLVPDFKSYDSLNPCSLPGLEDSVVLFGWQPKRSYFEIRKNRYNSNFGQDAFMSGIAMPELYFNIEVRRNFLNPFISHHFPLTVVFLMLFAITVTVSRNHEHSELFGFNVASVVGSSSALFFVVLIAHVQLREELSTNSIVYMEYFYLISYLVILLITVNAVLFSWGMNIPIIQYQNNLIAKIVYWPLILSVMFVCTALTFWL